MCTPSVCNVKANAGKTWGSGGGFVRFADILKAGGRAGETTRNEPVIIFATVAFGRERSSSVGGRPE
jgi:hypothetical protein